MEMTAIARFVRFNRPASTLPGPSSMKKSQPRLIRRCIQSVHRTVPVTWSRRASRISSGVFTSSPVTLLITGKRGDAWHDAAATIELPLVRLAIGRDVADESGAWQAALGIADDGALLVRPDQHVAWRGSTVPDRTDTVLDHVRGAGPVTAIPAAQHDPPPHAISRLANRLRQLKTAAPRPHLVDSAN